MLNLEDIAKVCHQANKAYCEGIGDSSQKDWGDCPDWQKDSAKSGVEGYIKNPVMKAEENHIKWMQYKLKEGWKYGIVKDEAKKEHPCMVNYQDLPKEQQAKDQLFRQVIRALLPYYNPKK